VPCFLDDIVLYYDGPEVPDEPQYIVGDVNGDGMVTIKDVTALIDYLLGGNAEPINEAAADVNQNGGIAINDVTALIDLLLSSPAK